MGFLTEACWRAGYFMKLAPVELVVFLIPPIGPGASPQRRGFFFDAPVLLHYANGPFPGSRTLNLVAVVSIWNLQKRTELSRQVRDPPKAPPPSDPFRRARDRGSPGHATGLLPHDPASTTRVPQLHQRVTKGDRKMTKLIGIAGSLALCSAASALELGTNEEVMSFKRCLAVIQKTARDAGTTPVNIVETRVMRTVQFPFVDGSILITCAGGVMRVTTSQKKCGVDVAC